MTQKNPHQPNQQQDTPFLDIRIGQLTSQWAKSRSYPVTFRTEMKSTNAWAKENLNQIFSDELAFHLVVTDFQSHGRGRGQHTWTSPKSGQSLLSSWCFALPQAPQPHLTLRVGLALIRATANTWPFLEWSLKAPNDLYLEGDKVAGLLVETLSQGNEFKCIVGLGLNVFESPEHVDHAVDIQSVLPDGVPLLGEDWLLFLDRFFIELTDALTKASDPLNTTDQAALLHFLNLNPNLEKPIQKVWPDGSLEMNGKKTSFLEL